MNQLLEDLRALQNDLHNNTSDSSQNWLTAIDILVNNFENHINNDTPFFEPKMTTYRMKHFELGKSLFKTDAPIEVIRATCLYAKHIKMDNRFDTIEKMIELIGYNVESLSDDIIITFEV